MHTHATSTRSGACTPAGSPLVCVVDDDSDVLSSLRFLLETEGFLVCTFSNPDTLLDVLARTSADCFVIDYKMPGMTGIELVSAMRRRHIDSPVILITGHPDRNIPAKARAAGINHVLIKPHVETNLPAHIWDALDDTRASS